MLFNYYDINNNISEGKELKKNNIKKNPNNSNTKSVMEYFQHKMPQGQEQKEPLENKDTNSDSNKSQSKVI